VLPHLEALRHHGACTIGCGRELRAKAAVCLAGPARAGGACLTRLGRAVKRPAAEPASLQGQAAGGAAGGGDGEGAPRASHPNPIAPQTWALARGMRPSTMRGGRLQCPGRARPPCHGAVVGPHHERAAPRAARSWRTGTASTCSRSRGCRAGGRWRRSRWPRCSTLASSRSWACPPPSCPPSCGRARPPLPACVAPSQLHAGGVSTMAGSPRVSHTSGPSVIGLGSRTGPSGWRR